MRTRSIVAVAVAAIGIGTAGAYAEESACPLKGQRPMAIVQMFFGLAVPGGGGVARKSWEAFLKDAVTPRFPDGFTVFDARGQWRDAKTSRIVRERTKVVEIATVDSAQAHDSILEIARLYRARFRQESVGIVTRQDCAAF